MKVAILTGASGGIGRAVAQRLIKDGYFVIAQYNTDKEGIESIKKGLNDSEKDYLYAVKADLSSIKSIDDMMDGVLKSFPHVDVLVNNAGVGLYKLIDQTTEKEWDKLFDINVKSAYYITNKVLGGMVEKKHGKIVNVSSMWGMVGASMEVAYSASKAALIGYTKALAKELAPSGINVNCVCPGVIDTPMNARFSQSDMQELVEQTPLGRIGRPNDVAQLVSFLCSEQSDFITGQVVACDAQQQLLCARQLYGRNVQ